MWYHAIIEFGESRRFSWNREKDELIADVVLPLVSKHVIITNRRGNKSLFNFGAASYVTLLGTPEKLNPLERRTPKELSDADFLNRHNVTEQFVNELRIAQSSPWARSLLQQALTEPLNQIFVIMKFGDHYLDSAYEGVIKPVGEEFGYKVMRVDEIQDSGVISAQILENIARSKLVLAELSGERPNSYYEAGYAHALGKQMIFVIKRSEKIHFDLAGHRFIRWETEAQLRAELRARFGALREADEE